MIPQYSEGTDRYHVPIRSLQDNLDLLQGGGTIDLDPDFQRPHVWTDAQQEAFIEHVLRGGRNAGSSSRKPPPRNTETDLQQARRLNP